MIHIIFSLIFCFLFQSIECTQWKLTSAEQAESVRAEIGESFLLTGLSYSSDVTLSQKEFDYLTGLTVGQPATRDAIYQALIYLFQKNIWNEIVLKLKKCGDGNKVHFDLKGFWKFEAIKLKGIWVGKEWYKQFYLMEPGDSFDAEKHAHSIEKMKEACKREGFFNVRAHSSFKRDKNSKGVMVTTTINRGGRFAIRKNSVELKADQVLNENERRALQRQLEKRVSRGLLNAKYAKSLLVTHAKELKDFLAQKGFLQVSIDLKETFFNDRRSVHTTWRLDISKKREFVFFGNHFFSSKQLLEQALQFGRSSFIVPASILAHEIKKAYNRKGFWQVEIDAKDEQERSFFVIKEGPRASIANVILKGVHSLPERKVRKRSFSKIKRHALFDRALLDRAFELLIDQYLKAGFLDAAVVHHEYVPENNKKKYTLVVTVSEGEQTCIASVCIPGYEQFEKQGPFALFHEARSPIAYDAALIQEQKRFLAEQLQKDGYLFPKIQHELVKEDGVYRSVWGIDAGHPIQFGKTIVNAQTDISFDRIIREISYTEGSKWDSEKIKQAFARLKSLNLFESISFTPLPVKEGDVARDVLLKIRKDDPFELRVRAGLEFQYINQYQTFGGMAYKVGGTFMVKNPTNHADLFRFDADVARSHREVHMKYLYPWVFNTPCNGVIDGYATKYEQPGFIGSKRNLYTLYQNGFLVGLRHKSAYVDAGINLGFEVARTTFSDDDLKTREAAIRLAQAINFDVQLLDQRVSYLFFEPTLMVDLLDNNLYPSKGMFTLISCKGMFPTSERFMDAYFFKLLVEHSWFVPLKQWVGAFRLRFGHIFHKEFNEIMPNERFYLGGSHSVRSYETDLAPPTSIFVDDDDTCHVVPRGGKTMVNANAELRIPVAKKAGFVLFQDFGILSGDSFADFKPDNIVAGTGFGLRFFTPIGPLRFDIGWKWKKDHPDQRRFNWVLTFGNAF